MIEIEAQIIRRFEPDIERDRSAIRRFGVFAFRVGARTDPYTFESSNLAGSTEWRYESAECKLA